MMDEIWGQITKVITNRAFEIKVIKEKPGNKQIYEGLQQVKISNIVTTDLKGLSSSRMEDLEKNWLGKKVHCSIQTRNNYGELICRVSVLSPTNLV